MREEKVQIEIRINETVDIDVHISDVMHSINSLPIQRKWSVVAEVLTCLYLGGKDKDGDDIDVDQILTDEQKKIVKSFLENQLLLL